MREEDGSWHLVEFYIEDFEVLDDSRLHEVIDKLRAVEAAPGAITSTPCLTSWV